MSEWHELQNHEQHAANTLVEHRSDNPDQHKYPLTRDGIHRYLKDYGGKLVVDTNVKIGVGGVSGIAGWTLSQLYGPKVIAYLEKVGLKAAKDAARHL